MEHKPDGVPEELSKVFENLNGLLQSLSDDLRRIYFGLMPLKNKERSLTEGIEEIIYAINEADT